MRIMRLTILISFSILDISVFMAVYKLEGYALGAVSYIYDSATGKSKLRDRIAHRSVIGVSVYSDIFTCH